MNEREELVDWGEAAVEMAIEERHGATLPPDLGERILQRVMPARPARRVAGSERSIAAAAIMLLGIGVVLAVAMLVPKPRFAQEPDRRLLPLDPGATWVYDLRRQGGKARASWRATSQFELQSDGDTAPRSWCQLIVEDGDDRGVEYAAMDASGLYRVATKGGLAGLEAADAVSRLLPLPAVASAKWETVALQWHDQAAGGGGRAGRMQRSRWRVRGEIVAMNEAVKVPAGAFEAVHVRLFMRDAEQQEQAVEQLWFAAGVGIVKRVLERDGKEVEMAELASYTAGKAEPEPRAVLAEFLRRDAGIANLGPAQATAWIASPARFLQLRTHFAVVTFVDRKVVFAVRGGKVASFDPDSLDAWTQLLADEGLANWSSGLQPQARCMALGDVACRVHGSLLGMTDLTSVSTGWRIAVHTGGADYHTAMTGKDGKGEAGGFHLDLVVQHDGGTVTKLEFGQ